MSGRQFTDGYAELSLIDTPPFAEESNIHEFDSLLTSSLSFEAYLCHSRSHVTHIPMYSMF